MHYNQRAAKLRDSLGYETVLVPRVIRIRDGYRERISKDRRCLFERNTMLAKIEFGLPLVPFEPKQVTSVSSTRSEIMAVGAKSGPEPRRFASPLWRGWKRGSGKYLRSKLDRKSVV